MEIFSEILYIFGDVITLDTGHGQSRRRAQPSSIECSVHLRWVRRELRAILPVCLSLLLGFYSFGFSAVALPDMLEEARFLVVSYSFG